MTSGGEAATEPTSDVPTSDGVVAGIDLRGRTAMVTGANGGLGRATARALASAGATVLLGVRERAAGEHTARRIREAVPAAALEIVELDLADTAGIAASAAQVRGAHPALNLLVNNAGVMYPPLRRTADGFELQFGVNHLGHFLLTTSLRAALAAGAEHVGAPSRVVTVSSDAHRAFPADPDDPNFLRRDYDKFAAYGQSKSANVLMTTELDRRWAEAGIRGFAVHPGVCRTKISRHMNDADFAEMARLAAERSTEVLSAVQSPAAGAATSTWACTAPDLEGRGGDYLSECAVAAAAPHACEPSAAEGLWGLSAALVAPVRSAR